MAGDISASEGDLALLERIKAGDDAALSEVIHRYQGQVYRFGMKMCRNHEDAEDVLQETLLAAARTIRGFRGASSMSTWFYSIARSFCIKKRRRSKFAPEHEASIEQDVARDVRALEDPGRSPEEHVQAQQIEKALQAAIRELDPKYREILVLRDVEGLTAPEVAEITDLTVAAVKSRLHRARAQLKVSLGPAFEPAPAPKPTTDMCSTILERFSQHLEGEISADLCADMQKHVDECPHCKQTCDSLKMVLSACRASPTPEVPERIQAQVRMSIQDLMGSR